jgi:large subunit ribosomal protein L15e
MANMYKYVKDLWKKPKQNLGDEYKKKLIEWRKEDSVLRIERPTRIDRARILGYKAKQGYIVLRVKMIRGGRKHVRPSGGRKPKNMSQRKDLEMNYRWVCEMRAQRRYPTLEVLNSYFVGNDGKFIWYEIIMIDPEHPSIKADDRINWICNSQNKGRVFRGLTSAGKEARGLRHKGKGAEHLRPSVQAYLNKKRAHQRKIKPLGVK